MHRAKIKNVQVHRTNNGILAEIFLPKGYPNSVSDDYAIYQIWDSCQALCSSVMGSLSANSVFRGIGVGDETASALSATSNWILRQGLGKLASISFAYINGSRMGADCKKFRLLADIVNDLALTINLLSSFLPYEIRPYIYAISSICWAIVGIAGSCTRTSLTIHQAENDNAADVQAKDQSQETLVELFGLVLGYIAINTTEEEPRFVIGLFILSILAHLYCNYRAVTSVRQSTLNLTRARIIMKEYMKTGNIISIKEANSLEPVVFSVPVRRQILIGSKWTSSDDALKFSDNVAICITDSTVKIYLTDYYEPEELFNAVIYAVMVEYKVQVTKFDDIIASLKDMKYSTTRNHFIIEPHRVLIDK